MKRIVTGHDANGRAVAIIVLDPSGKILRELAPPEGMRPTNVGFGRGADAASLYVTTLFHWRLFRIDTNRRGHYWDR